MEAVGTFNEGLARYRDAHFEEAARWFEEALKANRGDSRAAWIPWPVPASSGRA